MPGRLFNWLMRLLPRDFREDFGEEMQMVFEAQRGQTKGSAAKKARFWARLAWGMLLTAPGQHMEQMAQDLRYGLRGWMRRPLLTVTAAFSLAVGIGAATTVFSVFQATILHRIPGVKQPDRLVNVHFKSSVEESFQLSSYPNYLELRQSSSALADLAGFNGLALSLSTGAAPEVVASQIVTPNYFSTMGIEASRGRLFLSGQEADPSALISHWLWVNRFGSDAGIVGRSIRVNGHPFNIIGVLPEGFRGHFTGFKFDLFIPSSMAFAAGRDLNDRSASWVEMIGRLSPGVTVQEAQAEADLMAERMAQAHPEVNRGLEILLEPNSGIDQDLRGGLLAFLSILMGISALVLLVACVNVAGMLLARLAERRREMSLRLALGAARSRLARQLLTESLLLSLLGGGLGLLLAGGAAQAVNAALPAFGGVITLDVHLNASTVLWGMLLCLLTAVLLGWLPARRAGRAGLAGALGQDGLRMTAGARLRGVLVAGQVALSLIVLISGGLFVRALQQAAGIDPGMDLSNLRIAFLDPTLISMPQEDSRRFFDQLARRVQGLPEVESAGLASRVPLSLGARFFSNAVSLQIPGRTPPDSQDGFRIESSRVSQGYFQALRISIVEGRGFESADREGSSLTAVVNQSFVERFWPNQSGVGRQLILEGQELTVVGVAGDAKYRTLEEPPAPFVYLPYFQHFSGRATLLARPRQGISLDSLARSLQTVVRGLAPDLPIRDATTLAEHVEVSLLPQRIASAVAVTLGLVALLLALVGLYSVVSYSVSQRRREIGVRMSLGARPRQVVRLALRQGLVLVSVGILIGLPLAAGLSHLLERFLMGLSPVDFATYLSVSALLAAVGLLAGYLPARRAAQIDPVRALRAE